jgi:hypothetical protein
MRRVCNRYVRECLCSICGRKVMLETCVYVRVCVRVNLRP